jgi:adenylate cyclase
MTDYSREETAARAGVPVEFVDRLVELGVLKPAEGDRFVAADARKAAVVKSLEGSGIPLEDLADAFHRGTLTLAFLEEPAYDRFAPYTTETFAQASERTGVPLDLLLVVREAAGGALPSPDDFVREDELEIVRYVKVQYDAGLRPLGTERLLRVMGDTVRRLTDAEAAWWHEEVVAPRLAAGDSADAISAPEFADAINDSSDRALMAVWHAHQTQAWTRNIVDGFEALLERAGLRSRMEKPPAMCFLDITGYTRLTQERGDQAAAELAAQLSRLVQRSSLQHAGRTVKWLGDGVMFYFADPGPGVVAALEMVEGVADAGLPPAHVGLHAGPVIFQQGDYFGQTVNLASRIAEYARPGEVLVTEEVVEVTAEDAVRFTDIGPVELKGVAEAVHLHSARRA